MKRWTWILAVLITMLGFGTANAQIWNCGQHMVETGVGTTKEEVRDKCGSPTVDEGDRWYYKNQPGQVTVVLVFETGRLMQIERVPE